MKCDGCPIGEECDDQPCSHERNDACRLAPDNFRIIRAMIGGDAVVTQLGVSFGFSLESYKIDIMPQHKNDSNPNDGR